MKSIILFIALIAIVFSYGFGADEELRKCIEKNCPDQFTKCQNTKGCEDKLEKCEERCGAKVAAVCWTSCIGLPGPAANVCTCAVNNSCLKNSFTSFLARIVDEFTQ